MFKDRPKLIAILTGFISITICIIYLLLITVLDFRSILNSYITNHKDFVGVIFFVLNQAYSL